MDDNEFDNAPKEVLLEGAKACQKNATELFESATLLAKQKKYPSSTSLMILSVEESIKCSILLAGFLDIELPFRIKPFFRFHPVKHKQAAEIQPMITLFHKVFFSLKQIVSQSKSIVFDVSIFLLLSSALDTFFGIEADHSNEVDWFNKANALKKKGFYVDYIDKEWIEPSRISRNTYLQAKEITVPFIEVLKLIDQIGPDDYKAIIDLKPIS